MSTDNSQWDARMVVATGDVHLVPVGDEVHHEDDEHCPCGPQAVVIERNAGGGGMVFEHHSLDGRERRQQHDTKAA